MSEAVESQAHAPVAFDPSNAADEIMSHVVDSAEYHNPITGAHYPLEVFGYDLGITKHVALMWLACAILLFFAWLAVRRVKDPVPRGIRNVFEVLVLFIRDEVARRSIPHEADRYLSYLLTVFFFILICSLVGLVPGLGAATGNISVTAALAVLALVVIQWAGIRRHGVIKHFKNLLPPGLPFWLVPIMLVVEILSMFIRPFALCVRLFANMMAGHVVIGSFIVLIFLLGWIIVPLSVGFVLFVDLLELVIAFIQAYIFTMLTANFIGMSVEPSH